MAKVKAPKKISKRHELRQDAVITFYARVQQYYEQNRGLITAAGVGVVVLIVLIAGYFVYQNRQNAQAAELMGGIIGFYERGDYQQALEGLPDRPGLIEIADNYGRTREGNLARFLAADALYRIGEVDDALYYFRQHRRGSDYIGASSYAGEAAVHEDQGDFARAADLYRRAAAVYESPSASPRYLLAAARGYEQAGDFSSARNSYEKIRDDFPGSQAAANVNIYLARLDALADQ